MYSNGDMIVTTLSKSEAVRVRMDRWVIGKARTKAHKNGQTMSAYMRSLVLKDLHIREVSLQDSEW